MNSLIKNDNIGLLHNSAIDIVKWDETVQQAPNARIYAMSWYLDILHPDWHGLVYGDYNYVMPVIYSSKFGIPYAYQPVYAQQHGVFPPATPQLMDVFIAFLKKKFRFFEISFNHFNLIKSDDVELVQRKNYILSLYNAYNEIWSGFSKTTKQSIKKAGKHVIVSSHVTIEEFLLLKKNNSGKESKLFLPYLKQIMAHAIARREGLIMGAYSPHNELCAAAFFLVEKGRYTYLNSISSPEGKEFRAMFAILDTFIRNHSGEPLYLDFEGSEIESIAYFFAGFGAQPEVYPLVKFNRLPKIVKWIKKRLNV